MEQDKSQDEQVSSEAEASKSSESEVILKNRITELSKESAGYRVQRNEALRKNLAYETVLKAHNVDVKQLNLNELDSLPVRNGQVDGTFKYKPPKREVPKEPRGKVEGSAPITLDEVKKWPAPAAYKQTKAL